MAEEQTTQELPQQQKNSRPISVSQPSSRCESPLLPMGHHRTLSQNSVNPDRLSQQLETTNTRQSRISTPYTKSYAIHEEVKAEEPLPSRSKTYHRMGTMMAGNSSRMHSTTSKLKSACRKLNPKRKLAAKFNYNHHSHHQHQQQAQEQQVK